MRVTTLSNVKLVFLCVSVATISHSVSANTQPTSLSPASVPTNTSVLVRDAHIPHVGKLFEFSNRGKNLPRNWSGMWLHGVVFPPNTVTGVQLVTRSAERQSWSVHSLVILFRGDTSGMQLSNYVNVHKWDYNCGSVFNGHEAVSLLILLLRLQGLSPVRPRW